MSRIDWDALTQEWFARLDKGYATPPYTAEELKTLQEVLTEFNIPTSAFVLREQEETESQEDAPTEPQKRFHAASAEFLESSEKFTAYIKSRYIEPGREIRGLEGVYEELNKLLDSDKQQVAKIIGENTNRKLENGTFKIGKYETMLLRIINTNVRIENSSPFQLFFAIAFNGVLQGNTPGSKANVNIPENNGLLVGSFRENSTQSLGKLSQKASDILNGILTVHKLATGKQLSPNMNVVEVNAAIDTIESESGTQLVNNMITTSDSPTQKISETDKQMILAMLKHTKVETAAITFINEIDTYIRNSLKGASYWATITPEGMAYIKPIARIYKIVKPNKKALVLPDTINDFSGNSINVRSSAIHSTLLEMNDSITEDVNPEFTKLVDFMRNATIFEKYVMDKYAMEGQAIAGLPELYEAVLKSGSRDELIELLADSSKRDLTGKNFKMNPVETILFEKIMNTIRIQNGHPSELWFAIIFNGEVKGGVAGDSGITSDVDVDSQGVSLKSYAKLGTVDFGSIPVTHQRALRNIISVSEVITSTYVNPSITRGSLEEQFRLLSDPKIKSDIRALIELSETTNIKILESLGKKITGALGGRDVDDMVEKFIDDINAFIREKVESVSYWGIIIPSKRAVYLDTSEEIYRALESDPKTGRLSDGIIQFKGNKLYINGNKIHNEIMN